jgi:glycosyltransferase involved in cell wall biosynthesis
VPEIPDRELKHLVQAPRVILTNAMAETNSEETSAALNHAPSAPRNLIVSIVIPMRNESEHIRSCLDSLVNQTFSHDKYEIVVVDGKSTDNSRHLVSLYEERTVSVHLLENPSQTTPFGMNLGIQAASGNIVIIAGAHTVYPADFVENCVLWLDRTGADVVGGPVETVIDGDYFGARLVMAILSSPFGVGNSKFRTSRKEGFVDTVPFGAFRREIFDRVGMYNEKLVRNQDNELNARIRKAGGRIYLTPALTTHYHPVKNFMSLLKYAFKTSKWHIFTLRENRESMGLRHLAPAMFLTLLLFLLSASLVRAVASAFLIGILCAYILIGFYFSLRSKTRGNWDVALVQPFATLCFHIAYGAGTLFGLRYLFGQPSIRPIRPGLSIQQ